jgi:hypothetical protein
LSTANHALLARAEAAGGGQVNLASGVAGGGIAVSIAEAQACAGRLDPCDAGILPDRMQQLGRLAF